MPKNKKAQSTVKDLMIIAIFIFSLSAFTLSIYNHHQLASNNYNSNNPSTTSTPTGYFMLHISRLFHGKHKNENNNHHQGERMFHPREYKYNGPLTQQQVVEQTPAYHILKDIYTLINGKYYPISTKEGYINGSLIDVSSLSNKLSKEFVRKSGDVMNGDLNMNNHDIKNVNEIDVKRLCVNGSCTSSFNFLENKNEEENQENYNNNFQQFYSNLSSWHIVLYQIPSVPTCKKICTERDWWGDCYAWSIKQSDETPDINFDKEKGVKKIAEYEVPDTFTNFCLLNDDEKPSKYCPSYTKKVNLFTYSSPLKTHKVIGGVATAIVRAEENSPIITITYNQGYALYFNDKLISSKWNVTKKINHVEIILPLRIGDTAKITIKWFDECNQGILSVATEGIKIIPPKLSQIRMDIITEELIHNLVLPSFKTNRSLLYYYFNLNEGDKLCEQTYGQGWHWCSYKEWENRFPLPREGILALKPIYLFPRYSSNSYYSSGSGFIFDDAPEDMYWKSGYGMVPFIISCGPIEYIDSDWGGNGAIVWAYYTSCIKRIKNFPNYYWDSYVNLWILAGDSASHKLFMYFALNGDWSFQIGKGCKKTSWGNIPANSLCKNTHWKDIKYMGFVPNYGNQNSFFLAKYVDNQSTTYVYIKCYEHENGDGLDIKTCNAYRLPSRIIQLACCHS